MFFGYTFVANAAGVSIVAPKTIESNQQFSVTITLNTGGVVVNSFDISLTYPSDIISFKGYKEEGSIKKTWFVSPRDESGTIHFIGVIPNGVNGLYDPDKKGLQPIPIVKLLFSPIAEGQGLLNITHSDVLQNDGLGTPLSHEQDSALIVVLHTALSLQDGTLTPDTTNKDQEPPEPFVIQYVPASFFSRTPPMIIFSTTDKDSGVDKYQIYISASNWKDVTSPLIVSAGLVRRSVLIRALDFQGNIQQSEVEIPGIISSLQLFIIIILCGVCYFIFFVVKRKR